MGPLRAVAVVVREPSFPRRVLAVRRPEDDPELPGEWGLPAATLLPGEAVADAAARLGRAKLGSALALGRRIGSGQQVRPGYTLWMELYEATLTSPEPVLPPPGAHGEGTTRYTEWRWAAAEALVPAAVRGSLCCRLFLGRSHWQVHPTPGG